MNETPDARAPAPAAPPPARQAFVPEDDQSVLLQNRERSPIMVLGSLIILTVVGYLFGALPLMDQMIPFKSVTFVLGAGLVFFWAMTFSVYQALQIAVGVLTLFCLMRWRFMPGEWVRLAVEVPLMTLFLFGLAVIPNLIPWMLEEEITKLRDENSRIDEKLNRLKDHVNAFQKKEIQDRAAQERKEMAYVTSRITALNGFARELQQAGGQREIMNLLFLNLSKVLAVEECLLLVPAGETAELVVVRALHKEYQAYENARQSLSHPLLRKVWDERKMVVVDPAEELIKGMECQLLSVVTHEGSLDAVFMIGRAKTGTFTPDDLQLIRVLVAMTEGAAEQFRIATTTA